MAWRLLHIVTRGLYLLAGGFYLVLGVVVLLLGTGVLPAWVSAQIFEMGEHNPSTMHLVQETATLWVLVGMFFLWFARHYEHSTTFHWAVTFYLSLDAFVHWFTAYGTFEHEPRALINAIPFFVFLMLGLLRRMQDVRSRRASARRTAVSRRALAIALALTASAFVVAQNRSPADLANASVPPGAIRISYGSDPLQFGELRLPPHVVRPPVAIVVHGGCWVSELGNFDPRAVALDNTRPMAAALTEAGIATWNVEYRRLGHTGGGWPGTYQDVGLAADALRTIARQHPIDLTRVISIGHSAGGHFALWLAGRSRIPAASELYAKDPIRLTGAVNLDGPGDLTAMLAAQGAICGRPVITELMGGSPTEVPDRYRAGSPIELLPFGARIESLTGRAFGEQNAAFVAAARKAGNAIDATINPRAGHFVFIDPQSTVWPDVLASVRRILGMNSVVQ